MAECLASFLLDDPEPPKRGQPRAADPEFVARLHREGASLDEIREKVGKPISRATVFRYVSKCRAIGA